MVCRKWWLKGYLELLDAAIQNAFILFSQAHPAVSRYAFETTLQEQLINNTLDNPPLQPDPIIWRTTVDRFDISVSHMPENCRMARGCIARYVQLQIEGWRVGAVAVLITARIVELVYAWASVSRGGTLRRMFQG